MAASTADAWWPRHAGAGGAVARRATRPRRCARCCATEGRMSSYAKRPIDLRRLKTVRLAGARRQGARSRISRAPTRRASGVSGLARFAAAHPGGRFVSRAWSMRLRRRARSSAPIIWGLGGHVIKCGLAPVLIDLMRRGYATGFAMNGVGGDSRFRNRAGRAHQRRRGSGAARRPLRRGGRDRARDEPAPSSRAIATGIGHGRSAGPALERLRRSAIAPMQSAAAGVPRGDARDRTCRDRHGYAAHASGGGRRGDRQRDASRFPAVLLAGDRT